MLLGSQALTNDPYYKDVVLLLRGYDATSGQVFKDYSKTPKTITANGNVAHSTTQKKWGLASAYFDGSGDYLSVPSSANLNLSGDFTVEFWFNPNSMPTGATIASPIGKWSGIPANTYAWLISFNGSTSVTFHSGNNGVYNTGNQFNWNTVPVNGAWSHLSFSRSGTNLKAFLNGTQIGSTQTLTANLTSDSILGIGCNPDTAIQYYNGYIDDLRITKGVARYTSNFTVPTQPFPNW